VVPTSNNRVISSGDFYCCLLPQCKALRTYRLCFSIATVSTKPTAVHCALVHYCHITSGRKRHFQIWRSL